MNTADRFRVRVTAILRCQSHFVQCCQLLWIFLTAPKDPELYNIQTNHSAATLHSAVKSIIHTIMTGDEKS